MSTEMKPRLLNEYSPGPNSKGNVIGSWQPPSSYDYRPVPPVLSQKSSSDAVVINQPLAPPSKVDAGHTRAKEYFTLTVVMMLLCFLHGNLLAFICLIPAFYFSRMASNRNDSGDYKEARKFGNAALCCNICVIILYILLILVAVVLVTVYFTAGFSGLVGGALADVAVPLPNTITEPTISVEGEFADVAASLPNAITEPTINVEGELADVAASLPNAITESTINVEGELADVAASLPNTITVPTIRVPGPSWLH